MTKIFSEKLLRQLLKRRLVYFSALDKMCSQHFIEKKFFFFFQLSEDVKNDH